ncbi:MAG: GNAT family N-acetyltransferase [Chloroflexi bacterium]|nr:GNAT family N-acetyltransferase [Chloroflexota bacterium]
MRLEIVTPHHLPALVSIWNAACGDDLAINERLMTYNTRPATGAIQFGRVAVENDQPVGFVIACALPNDPQTAPRDLGWIDALAVTPAFQRRGVGGALLASAEAWLHEQGCARVRLGGGLHYFLPGYPVALNGVSFFQTRGYAPRPAESQVCDLARDLRDCATMQRSNDATTRPAQPTDADAILDFLRREFPGRWRFEFEEFLRERGRFADYLLLETARGLQGVARMTREDSERPIERFYPHRLPHPWGQIGSIGISRDARGKGYGGALLDAGLRHMRAQGVRGCIIDWTSLVELYRKFGFTPYRWYAMLIKNEQMK